MSTIDRLKTLHTLAHAMHPNVGAWLVSATRREVMILTALMRYVETWHDTVRAKWLASVVADTYEWNLSHAWDIAHHQPDSEVGWHADRTPSEWWHELRHFEELRIRDEEEGVA
jgi:hypothetical protein